MQDNSDIRRIAETWGLSETEVASLRRGSSTNAIDALGTATEVLTRRVRPERIPAVVRRPAPMLDGRSLLELAMVGDYAGVLRAVQTIFDLGRVAP